MLNMFQSFNGFSMFGSSISIYKPYINYTWSNTFQVANKMYSKNIGNSGQDLRLFSGQGFRSNGTNQTITIPVNATVLTEIKRVNGSVVLNANQQVITDYVIGTGAAAVHTDYFLFTDALTADEIALYSANPNQFFQNVQDGIIDNCVLNMPLHGIDKYHVDYSRYSVGLVNADVTLSNSTPNGANTTTKINNVFRFTNTVAEPYNYMPIVRFFPLVYDTSLYTVKIKVKCISGTAYVRALEGTPQIVLNKLLTAGQEYAYESATRFSNIGGQKGSLTFDGLNYTKFTIEVTIEVYKVVAGVNEVINYTADCVALAKQLPYGSQEANFFHASNGVPIRTGLSPFLESTTYWNNYGDTGYASPLEISHETFELIIQRPKAIQSSYNKYLCGGNISADLVVEINTNSNSGGYIRLRKAGTSFNINKWLNTDTMYIAMVCDGISVYIYINGLLYYKGIPQAYSASYSVKLLGEQSGGNMVDNRYIRDAAVRLFKVHTKALTQEDITKNFNEYMARGLLANFLLDENGNYIKDESNNYIMT